MPAVGDVYFARGVGTVMGEQFVNTFWYVITSLGDAETFADDMVDWIRDEIYTAILPSWRSNVIVDYVEGFLWKAPQTDYFQNGSNLLGTETLGEAYPSYATYTFRSPKGFPGFPYGYKRFPGVNGARADGNDMSSHQSFDEVAVALGTPISIEVGAELMPCVVRSQGRPDMGSGLNPEVRRYVNGTWTYKLGSQLTRKPGYGD